MFTAADLCELMDRLTRLGEFSHGFTTGYDPTSANDCTSGRLKCVDAVIKEMDRRFRPLAQACDHNAMFSLAYLRTTEEYRRAITLMVLFMKHDSPNLFLVEPHAQVVPAVDPRRPQARDEGPRKAGHELDALT